jgi:hypothetical protein
LRALVGGILYVEPLSFQRFYPQQRPLLYVRLKIEPRVEPPILLKTLCLIS